MVKYKNYLSQSYTIIEDRLDTMLLVLAATEIEMMSFTPFLQGNTARIMTEVCGVGPVEAATRVMRLLCDHAGTIHQVVNFGIGGAYLPEPGDSSIDLLHVCIAESEALGDYGICYGDRVESFVDQDMAGKTKFMLDKDLLKAAREKLNDAAIDFSSGAFVTVNGASGTADRGRFLKKKFGAICENMEGAAIARCCAMYSLPMIEVRVISNMVEDRPGAPWKIKDACCRSGHIAALVVDGLKEKLCPP
jgi:futalosine hydrolase